MTTPIQKVLEGCRDLKRKVQAANINDNETLYNAIYDVIEMVETIAAETQREFSKVNECLDRNAETLSANWRQSR